MANPLQNDDPPIRALGRILGWVDRPGSGDRMFWALDGAVRRACLWPISPITNIGHFAVESDPGLLCYLRLCHVHGAYSGGKELCVFLLSGPKIITAQAQSTAKIIPQTQLEKVDHDGA